MSGVSWALHYQASPSHYHNQSCILMISDLREVSSVLMHEPLCFLNMVRVQSLLKFPSITSTRHFKFLSCQMEAVWHDKCLQTSPNGLLLDAQTLGCNRDCSHSHLSISHQSQRSTFVALSEFSYLTLRAYFEFESALTFLYYSNFI